MANNRHGLLPDNDKLLRIVNARTMLAQVIRGHSAIDAALAIAISEVLVQPHALQVRKLDASLKIDIAAALGLVAPDARPAYQKLNSIRNRFAHEPQRRLSMRHATDFRNTFVGPLKPMMDRYIEPPTPRGIVAHGIAILYMYARSSISRLRDGRAAAQELHLMTQEVLSPLRKSSPNLGTKERARVAAAVETARAARRARGDF